MTLKLLGLWRTKIARATSAISKSKSNAAGPIRLTIVCAVLLSVIVVSGSGFIIFNIRNRIRAVNERDLSNMALVLAKQIEQFFTTAETVQAGLIEDTKALRAINAADSERLLSSHEVYLKLHDKVAALEKLSRYFGINEPKVSDEPVTIRVGFKDPEPREE